MNDIGSAEVANPDRDGNDGSARGLLRAHVRAGWAAALQHERFDNDDDFFAIGGHSLLIAEIMAGLGALAGTRLSLKLFFDHPTVNELTDALAAHEAFGSLAR
ncbi:acyl carrier protein [Verrucosispora sioxanthis]|uniref:acyl carrier protein n=1 Tax=Verrucosispora sioxanthis TaxID=2499994 RepID=UPI001AA026E5|nr:acyl carrier protein [Verrucosispora sioxanthis]